MRKYAKQWEKDMQTAALKECRYYKGEDKCPFTGDENYTKSKLWCWEEGYVAMCVDADAGVTFARYLSDYDAAGLGNYRLKDGIPVRLKALLFTKYTDAMHSVDEFKQMYEEYYK